MSILSDFEDRVGDALEGAFASVFRSPVQPSEIAKTLAKAMDDGRTIGVGKVYAPASYVVALSPEDDEILGAFTATLASELATFLVGHARERAYHLAAKPRIAFTVHDDLRLGRFRVSAELAFAENAPAAGPALFDHQALDDTNDAPATPAGALATVTVGDTDHDVALRSDRVVVGRLQDCDICLSDANASRRHAAFVRDGGDWLIEDLDSTNGTYLNGRLLERPEPLRAGDIVEIGLTRLTFHATGR